MPESIEDVRASRSWTPVLMLFAFTVGAAATGWFVFREQIEEWARIEDVAWEPAAGERLVLVTRDRAKRVVTGEPERLVSVEAEWHVIPASSARVPGSSLNWTQSLLGGSWEIRDGDVPLLSHVLAVPDPTMPPTPPPPADPEAPVVPGSVALLDPLMALDFAVALDAAGSVATAAASPEVLEQIETRRTGRPLERRKPLELTEIDAIQADLGVLGQRVAFDLAACVPADWYRPGQTYTREVKLPLGEWGIHPVRLELEHQGYVGDVAIIAGTLARRPSEGALTSDDGLSGLKGDITCRYDIRAKRLDAARYRIEARGKSNRKFATLGFEHAMALAGPGETAAIPADLDLPPLPPPAAPVEEPPP